MHHAMLPNQKYEGGESFLWPGHHFVGGSVSGEMWSYSGFSLKLGIGSLTPRRGFTELYVLCTHENRTRAPELSLYYYVYCTRPFYWNGMLFTNGQMDESSGPVERLYNALQKEVRWTVTLT